MLLSNRALTPTGANILEYRWRVGARPKKKLWLDLYEVFGPNGYIGMIEKIEERFQKLSLAPRLYIFEYVGLQGGGGPGGPPSPGGGS